MKTLTVTIGTNEASVIYQIGHPIMTDRANVRLPLSSIEHPYDVLFQCARVLQSVGFHEVERVIRFLEETGGTKHEMGFDEFMLALRETEDFPA